MPSIARGRPSNSTPGVPTLPPYESPSHPLDEKAEHALQDLHRNHKLESLKNRLQAANNHLTDAAADINERLYVKLENYEKAKRRQETMSSQRSEEIDDDAVETMRQETESMTGRLDQRIREIIDARTEVANTESALRELEPNAAKNRRAFAATQSTIDVTQMRTPNRSGMSGGSGDENYEAGGSAQRPASLVDTLKERQAKDQAAYLEASLSDRYAAHNDYIGFRKIVHDARHPGEEAPPLSHPSTWFSTEANGAQDRAFTGAVNDGYDEDEDFQIASEKVSIKCPLTLLPMVEPVQSIKCSHNFEKEAILDMIRHSDIGAPADGEHGETQQFVQCPVCEKVCIWEVRGDRTLT